jgi:hypothetical protein
MVAAVGPSPRYEIVCSLARGGMAELFLAKLSGPAGFERLVVVKRLAATLADELGAMRALFDEARIVATLSHANIVQVHDVDLAGGQVSIVMELLHGYDVARLLRRLARMGEQLSIDRALAIALAVCAGLHHAHERRGPDGRSLDIVHRDVSPQNVFVTYDGYVKLVDFGIARATTRIDKTAPGVLRGKPGYIAPEQIRGQAVDRRTDVWATAVLIYEMTTGKPPFEGEEFDQMLAATESEPRSPRTIVARYPAELEQIVLRGMARDPADRYPTAEAMRIELEAFARKRSADLSPFSLAALMEHAFDAELVAWKRAQREGMSLAHHVEALRTGAHDVVGTGFVDDSPPVARPRRARLAIVAAAIALAVGVVSWLALRDDDEPANAAVVLPEAPQPAVAAPKRAPEPPPVEPAPQVDPEPAAPTPAVKQPDLERRPIHHGRRRPPPATAPDHDAALPH